VSIGPYHSHGVAKWLEPLLAALLTLLGIALTTAGAIVHAGLAVAPGGLLTLVGGGWLGNALARRDVRLFKGSS
jgi:hypothetical protein